MMKLRSALALALALAFASPAVAQEGRGSAPLTGPKGGTGNAFMQFSGPATSLKTFTLPNVSDTIAVLGQPQTWSAFQTFGSSIISPSVFGGTATNATLNLASSTSGSPSSDIVNIFGGTVNVRTNIGVGGLSTLNVGAANQTSGQIVIAGGASGATTLQTQSAAGGTLSLPNGADTLVARTSTDTLTNKTLTSPAISNPAITGLTTITSNSALALTVGPNGSTNPTFQVDASAASQANGLRLAGTAAGSSVGLVVVSPATNDSFGINAKGNGVVALGQLSTGTVQIGQGGGGATIFNSFTATGLVTYADMATAALATQSQYFAGTANTIPPTSVIYTSETTTTFGATTTFDFSTFINTAVTLTGNITTMTLSNVKAGQAGMITFIQDGTGSRTTVWSSTFKFAGGATPTLSTGAGAVDILFYSCRSASFCAASLNKAFN